MRVVTAEEMQRLDQTTIRDIGIPGLVLMENAGLKVVEAVVDILRDVRGKTVTVFAGKGNNGGDGFVAARHLLNMGVDVRVLLFGDPKEIKGDAKTNLDILTAMGHKMHPIINVNSVNIVKLAMVSTDLVVDAIFGIGFKGSVDEHIGNIIEIINAAGNPVVAVDIPSGLEANTGKAHGPCIRAARTVTFGLPKIGLLVYPGVEYTGKLIVADISIPRTVIDKQGSKKFLLTPELVRAWMPKRLPESHKGTFGRVAVIGGAEGMTGAAALAGMAALRAGAGLVTLGVPRSLHGLMEIKLTEVMTRPLPETDRKSISRDAMDEVRELVAWADVVAIGPGISTEPATQELIRDLVAGLTKPAVIDADGLNALAGHTGLLEKCRAPLVLTPHPGEMARLWGIKTAEVQDNRIEVATEAAKKWGATVVLKGARTLITASDGTLYINPTGNPGMATGGSGDVLTGIIAGFLAQGLSLVQAGAAGAYFHGLAADSAAACKGEPGLVAGDILDALPGVTKDHHTTY
jgi:NAD(P)H-hydrate epimerase